jgi:hypothetical protein
LSRFPRHARAHLDVGDDEGLGVQQAGLADQQHHGVDDQVVGLGGFRFGVLSI